MIRLWTVQINRQDLKKKKTIKMVGGVNEKQVCERSEVKSQRSVWGANINPDISTQSGYVCDGIQAYYLLNTGHLLHTTHYSLKIVCERIGVILWSYIL